MSPSTEQASAGLPLKALAFQDRILAGVSRTFALTIPTLPEALRVPVTNAYLLCRIADTIEDDAALSVSDKREFGRRFVAVTVGRADPLAFSAELLPRLAATTLAAEKELISRTDLVVALTRGFDGAQRVALTNCVEKMSAGMHKFQCRAGLEGVADQAEMDEYCYYVAGVVGEMLTELFCLHSRAIARQRSALMQLAPSFGQGLQMTNILKDVWDDRQRNTCWLPRSRFQVQSDRAVDLLFQVGRDEFRRGLDALVGRAHGHLRNAFEYTLLLPHQEKGIRRFCLWALGMAVLTLRKIHHNPDFRAGDQVKISRRTVGLVVGAGRALASRDQLLKALFFACSVGLPFEQTLASVSARWPPDVDGLPGREEVGHTMKTG